MARAGIGSAACRLWALPGGEHESLAPVSLGESIIHTMSQSRSNALRRQHRSQFSARAKLRPTWVSTAWPTVVQIIFGKGRRQPALTLQA